MAIEDTLFLPIEVILPVIAAIAAFAVAAGYTGWVAKQKPGTKEMLEISNAVKEGAAAFLRREMKIIIPIAIGLSVIIGFFIGGSNGIAFAVGATLSAIAGIISLKVTVKAAVRAANATDSGLGKTFAIAFVTDLVKVDHPLSIVKSMIDLAANFSEKFHSSMCNQDRTPITKQMISHIESRAQDVERLRQLPKNKAEKE